MGMSLQPYHSVLALPKVRSSLLLMFMARIPMAAMSIAITLHVVIGLGYGYGAAGAVGSMLMGGAAAGSPFVGRMLDRHGLRPVVAVCAVMSAAFWIASPWLSYEVLLLVAVPAGMLGVPYGPVAKQVLAALVSAGQLRTAYALDSMSTEVAFMLGPAGATAIATQVSTTVSLTAIGAAHALIGAAIWMTNPPLRTDYEAAADRTSLRSWLTPQLGKALLVVAGAFFVLAGMELAMLASLRASSDVEWTGLVVAIICLASMVGGLLYGAIRRSLSQLGLMVLLATLTVPVALAGQPWWLLALALVPMGLACAPTVAATSEVVAGLAPAYVRGQAMGLQFSASWLGVSAGSPVVGFVIDRSSVPCGFVAAGGGGLGIAAIAYALGWISPRRRRDVLRIRRSRVSGCSPPQ
ncbi:MFS transporter [Nocardia africana]|uniref:MFS transporter n=1 Tax=Nocardia africana TaxID=134964 RepID=A0ABW6NVJ2_9NOCA